MKKYTLLNKSFGVGSIYIDRENFRFQLLPLNIRNRNRYLFNIHISRFGINICTIYFINITIHT